MADIFLSYARKDRARVEPLAEALSAAGYSVWWDRRIEAGAEFATRIEAELNAAKVVVVLWSAHANESAWVRDEAAAAQEQRKLIPVSWDGVRPPLGFRQYQSYDLSGWSGDASSQRFQSVLASIASLASGGGTSGGTVEPSARVAGKRWRVPTAVLAMAALLLSTGIVWLVVRDSDEGLSGEPWIEVAPINVHRADPILDELAVGLAGEITSGLARFSYLLITSTPSDARDIRYRLEGDMRQIGQTVRVTMNLVDLSSGAHVWSAQYDRGVSDAQLLAVQDDLADRIVASVADPYGGLMRDLSRSVTRKTIEEMTPHEAVIRHSVYRQRLSPEDHRFTRDALEHAARLAPDNADVWAALAAVYIEEVKHDYNRLPGAADRALNAARRAIELEPDNAYGYFELAEVHFFRKELGLFRAASERAIALNPRDSEALAMLGILLGYAGDWPRSVEITTRAMTLNPNHPGWYRFNVFFDEYLRGNYQSALSIAERINIPTYFADAYARAVAHAQLGHTEEASAAMEDFRALWPDPERTFKEKHIDVWFYAQPELIARFIEGLRKAGLELD